MGFWEVVLIAVGLAMDASAVSLGIGAGGSCRGPRPTFRLAFHFGLFQALMPILGWFAGSAFAGLISGVDHWIAFALLAFVGGRMVRSGLNPACEEQSGDPSRGGMLVTLAIATSIDAMAVGLSLAMLGISVFYPAVVIGVVTAAMSLAALLVGGRLGAAFGKRMEIAGGLLLIGIGLRVVLSHLT